MMLGSGKSVTEGKDKEEVCRLQAGGRAASLHSGHQAPPPGFLKPEAGPGVWKLENIVTPEWEVTTPEPTHKC